MPNGVPGGEYFVVEGVNIVFKFRLNLKMLLFKMRIILYRLSLLSRRNIPLIVWYAHFKIIGQKNIALPDIMNPFLKMMNPHFE